MELVSIVVAALAGFAVGAVWYMGLSRPWMEAADLPRGPDGRPLEMSSLKPFLLALLAMVLVAAMMRHLFILAGIEGAGRSFLMGLGIGAFFVTPWLAMDYAYSMRDRRLTWIDGGYAILGCGVIGLVLGLV